MELCDIYCGSWEGMKEISVGVCLNDYTWLEIWKKKKWIVQKDQVKSEKKKLKKKYGLEQKQKEKNEERKKKSRSAIWALLCKVSGIGIIWKEKLCSTSL